MVDVDGGLEAYAEALDAGHVDPQRGLPNAVFDFALQITPMINVDLLVCDGAKRMLWAWRDDAFGTGWHIPGGIIRRREPWATRIAEVARLELGTTVVAEDQPCHVVQLLDGERGHFISLLFRCRLTGSLHPPRGFLPPESRPEPEQLAWFDRVPDPLYSSHEIYRDWITREAGRA